jgi:hypothetical protein
VAMNSVNWYALPGLGKPRLCMAISFGCSMGLFAKWSFRGLGLLAFLIFASSVAEYYWSYRLSSTVREEIIKRARTSGAIQLKDVTPFEWSSVYIVAKYGMAPFWRREEAKGRNPSLGPYASWRRTLENEKIIVFARPGREYVSAIFTGDDLHIYLGNGAKIFSDSVEARLVRITNKPGDPKQCHHRHAERCFGLEP